MTYRFKIPFYVQTGDKFVDAKKRVWTASLPIGHWKKNYHPSPEYWIDNRFNLWKIDSNICRKIRKADFDIEVVIKYEDQEQRIEPNKFIDYLEQKALVKIT